ncbi:MAG: hypothetical protein H6502_03400 [Candidatus Woesearchaeota archaeon]|nr:MAG: hypothetical protein H6502_03400 [Candidatus Woesearchaeota archaeon]
MKKKAGFYLLSISISLISLGLGLLIGEYLPRASILGITLISLSILLMWASLWMLDKQ